MKLFVIWILSMCFILPSTEAGDRHCIDVLRVSKIPDSEWHTSWNPTFWGDYPPHTIVVDDLNGDGEKDIFYLNGQGDVFSTTVCLGSKKSNSEIEYKSVHSHDGSYNTVFNFNNSNTPQILVSQNQADQDWDNCSDLIPESLKPNIKKSYAKWSKGYEKYNFTYNLPNHFQIYNLFLFDKVKIYTFNKNSKTDVTEKMSSYLNLKRTVLSETLSELDKKIKLTYVEEEKIELGKCQEKLGKVLKEL